MNPLALVVIMPVYNESECIQEVLQAWNDVLVQELSVPYEIWVYDDGSTDDSWEKIRKTADQFSSIIAIHHTNIGHGPTILRGYKEAAIKAQWILQVDSDDEINPEDFPRFWQERESQDIIIGKRKRNSPLIREFISWTSRKVIQSLFGTAIYDVNCPFRLMRSSSFAPIISHLPKDTFAPNLLISGAATRIGMRIKEIQIQHKFRATGHVSIRNFKLLRVAFRSFRQTLSYYLYLKKTSGSV